MKSSRTLTALATTGVSVALVGAPLFAASSAASAVSTSPQPRATAPYMAKNAVVKVAATKTGGKTWIVVDAKNSANVKVTYKLAGKPKAKSVTLKVQRWGAPWGSVVKGLPKATTRVTVKRVEGGGKPVTVTPVVGDPAAHGKPGSSGNSCGTHSNSDDTIFYADPCPYWR